jgi:hypothetical protein
LACPNCNQAKGDKWDSNNEILDASTDRPIEKHLTYAIAESGVYRIDLTKRGKTTIKHADLNRDELLTARLKVLLPLMQKIGELRQTSSESQSIAAKQMLKNKADGDYGTMIEYALKVYLSSNS